ncbi:MAG: GH3 auxin-responsive promoter family protein [Flavobacteriales bacterium]
MGLKSWLSVPIARIAMRRFYRAYKDPVASQLHVMQTLIEEAENTAFGKDHDFSKINSHADFMARVPLRDYEALKGYIQRVKEGEENVLWPGLPLYFCKTSGTTSGTKYIPLTRESLPNHIGSARTALFAYIAETGKADFVDGKMIFLQGSPVMEKLPSGIPFGRLSGIVANHVPAYLQKNRMPSFATNCIDDWETKVNAIADETSRENMTLISGIPSWVQMYFEILLKKLNRTNVREVFPNFKLFVFGGVNFEPYRARFEELIGDRIDSIELYPASEGFIAFQDSQRDNGLLLNVDSGIFFEFVRAEEMGQANPRRYHLGEVELGVNYALILSNNAGLWGYSIGDTVKFVSLDPPKIRVTGRIKHFTSAFGEHVIAEEVEQAMAEAVSKFGLKVNEFHVAPQVAPASGLPYHEWLVEWEQVPTNLEEIALFIDQRMTELNVYYKDLISGNVLRTLVITSVRRGGFNDYMRSQGKLGGQNKIPRLANDRQCASVLEC